jgi:hypothetical protein
MAMGDPCVVDHVAAGQVEIVGPEVVTVEREAAVDLDLGPVAVLAVLELEVAVGKVCLANQKRS